MVKGIAWPKLKKHQFALLCSSSSNNINCDAANCGNLFPIVHSRKVSSDQLAPPSEESVRVCRLGSITRLFSNGEVKSGRERRTISIDSGDLYLIV